MASPAAVGDPALERDASTSSGVLA